MGLGNTFDNGEEPRSNLLGSSMGPYGRLSFHLAGYF